MSFLRNAIEQAARAKQVVLDYFTYNASWVPMTASATLNRNIPISADSDFLWMETCLSCFDPAGTNVATPDLLISFLDTGSGRNLQDNPTHSRNVTGNGQWPFVLPEPKLLIGNGAIQITLVNNSATEFDRVDVTLIGFKVFYVSGYNRNQLVAGF